MISQQCPNINLLWGKLLIEELYRLGITDICIAPGSRSTPLTIAASEHNKIITHCHFDERGLGYFALGLAKYKRQAIAIITTSGGAVANLHPAIVEASISQVPLIVLSGDRPNELIGCGANQAINQQGIFSHSVVHQVNLPTASTNIAPQFLLTSVDEAITKMRINCGPIHINCMYREPFYPQTNPIDFSQYLSALNAWQQTTKPYSQYHQLEQLNENNTIGNIQDFYSQLSNKKILIVCGQLSDPDIGFDIAQWAQNQNMPLLLDSQSSIKGHPHAIHYYDQLLHLNEFKQTLLQADIIVQFGTRIISKRLTQFIASADAQYWLICEGTTRVDPSHRVNQRFMISTKQWLTLFSPELLIKSSLISLQNTSWQDELSALDQRLSAKLNQYDEEHTQLSEYSTIRVLGNILPDDSLLFLGNSMPVRLFDMFALATAKKTAVFTSRGASGIDGLAACAAGIAKGNSTQNNDTNRKQTMTLVIGDTSLLHDLNSLALVSALKSSFIIIVLNNDGGAIFNLLPVSDNNELRKNYYQMPHGLKFENACAMFKLPYFQPTTQQQFIDNYATCLTLNKPCLIEVNVPSQQTTNIVIELGQKFSDSSSF